MSAERRITMTRTHPPSLLTTIQGPPPSGVWAMTMAVLGSAFGAALPATSQGSVKTTLRRPIP